MGGRGSNSGKTKRIIEGKSIDASSTPGGVSVDPEKLKREAKEQITEVAEEKTKKRRGKRAQFNDFRFEGLDWRKKSNKYITMDRVSKDGKRCVVKVDSSNLVKTQYGWGLKLDSSHVVFLKNWQVSDNWYGTEVLLTKDYFKPKKWGDFPSMGDTNKKKHGFDWWLDTAKKQAEQGEDVYW